MLNWLKKMWDGLVHPKTCCVRKCTCKPPVKRVPRKAGRRRVPKKK